MKKINYITAILIIIVMCSVAEISRQQEIIFPEIAALIIGTIISKQQPWEVDKPKLWFLMTFCAFIGISIVSYIHIPVLFQIMLGFLLSTGSLFFSRTSLVPAVSACILPIISGTESIIYPISVSFMCFLIILSQFLSEKFDIKKIKEHTPLELNFKEFFIHYLKLVIGIFLVSSTALYFGHLYIVAPPLIVAFIEFSNSQSQIRKKPIEIVGFVGITSIFGVSLLYLCNAINMPVTIAAVMGCIVLFSLLEKTNFLFPPLGAILLLPLIIPQENLIWYPFETTLGAAFFTTFSLLSFKKEYQPIKITQKIIETERIPSKINNK